MAVYEIRHPLVKHNLTKLRDRRTDYMDFRRLVSSLSIFMVYEALRDINLSEVDIITPMEPTKGKSIDEKSINFFPVIRAGLAMTDGALMVVPGARVGHFGIFRNEESLEPVEYYRKFPPDVKNGLNLILDPMLATGGTSALAVDFLREKEVPESKIKIVCIISAPEGIGKIVNSYDKIDIYTASIDDKLNEVGYILPGLGDAGDRAFGTLD
ncbi:MAG: uracil phosphoribosyltransferase [Candidatus Eremiobacteraeota bacterium]|nr:uracil phosphoribosyltransferase [Candidatus Eremiobacteraeota bacterium]